MKIKFIWPYDLVGVKKEKEYEVISIEKGWYRIMTELGEDYLFPPSAVEVIEEDKNRDVQR